LFEEEVYLVTKMLVVDADGFVEVEEKQLRPSRLFLYSYFNAC
jgi:hypothetical protein